MELKHEFDVPAGLDESWEAFNDIGSIAGCFPGATLLSVDGDRFEGIVKIKLGPISMQYSGTAEFVERDTVDRRIVIRASGKDKRGQGSADATVTAQLDGDDAHTRFTVQTDLAITGKPAQFGRGMIEDVSERLLTQFVDNVSQQLTRSPDDDPTAGSDDAATPARRDAPAPAAPAAPVASIDLVSTVLPVLARRYGVVATGTFLGFLAGWLLARRRR